MLEEAVVVVLVSVEGGGVGGCLGGLFMITFRVGGAGDLSPYSVVLVSLLDHVLRTPGLPVSIVLAGGCSARKSIEQFEQDDDRKNVCGDCRKKGQKVQWLGRGLLQHRLVLLEGHV